MLDAGYTQWSLIDEADENTTYFGFVGHAQPDSNPKCSILRTQKTGTVTIRMWADGNMARTQNWNDRVSLTYKFLQ
jgi:hypothetical protein